MIRLRTLGGLALDGEGAPLLQRRPLALLAVLAVVGDLGISRDKLLAYFWPESDEDRGRNVLRQLLHSIRRDVGEPELFVGTTELRLNPELLASDFAEFERACDGGDWEVAVSLYRGPFLDGFYLSNAVGFETWKESERARLARRFADAAEQVARRAAAAGDHAKAIGMWQRLAVVEPLNSRIAIELMRAMAAAGDVGGALNQARVHGTLLREEIGTDAPREVTLLVEELKNRGGPESTSPLSREGFAVGEPVPRAAFAVSAEMAGAEAWRPSKVVDVGRFRAWLLAGTLLVLAVIFGARASWRLSTATGVLDPTAYVALPFLIDSAGTTDRLQLDRRLNDALSGWYGVRLVDQIQTDDAIRQSGRPRSLQAALRIARNLHARNLIWGRGPDWAGGE